MDNLLIWILLLGAAWLFEAIGSARRRQQRGGQPTRRPPLPDRPEPHDAPDTPRSRTGRGPMARRQTFPTERPPHAPMPESEVRRTPERAPSRAAEREPVVFPPELIILREPAKPPPSLEPRVRRVPPPEPEPEPIRPVVSLETVEPSGEARHEAFHAKYVDRPRAPLTRRRVPRLGRAAARRGIILAEILGPPRSER